MKMVFLVINDLTERLMMGNMESQKVFAIVDRDAKKKGSYLSLRIETILP